MSAAAFVDRRDMVAAPTSVRAATLVDANLAVPQQVGPDGSRTWLTRGANFVVAITRALAGTRLARSGQPDEYMLYLPPGGSAEVMWNGRRTAIGPDSLTIVPSGDSDIVVGREGDVFRLFSSRATDLAVACANAAIYADDLAEVAPLVDWPAPPGGWAVRTYPLADVTAGNLFGRVYRSTNLMVNLFEPYAAARDQAALSPHSHADFEQASLTVDGRFEHYLRTPWGKDRAAWRPDETVACGSPSVTVIPAGVVHTTAWLGADGRMIDVFAPPRADFSRKAGWVRNAADYPSPDWLAADAG